MTGKEVREGRSLPGGPPSGRERGPDVAGIGGRGRHGGRVGCRESCRPSPHRAWAGPCPPAALALTPVRGSRGWPALESHATFSSGSAEDRHGGPLVHPSFDCFSDPGGARPGHFTAYPELFSSEASGPCGLGGLV